MLHVVEKFTIREMRKVGSECSWKNVQQTESDCNKYFKLQRFASIEQARTSWLYLFIHFILISTSAKVGIGREAKYSIHCLSHEQMNKICNANRLLAPSFTLIRSKFFQCLKFQFLFFSCRKCVCNSSNTVREKPSKRSKLFNLVISGGRSFGCMPCNASVGGVRDIKRVEARAWAVRYVDEQWRSLLHRFDSTSGRDSIRSVRNLG